MGRYQRSHLGRSLWQAANSFVPYFVLWVLMVQSLSVSYWLTLGLAVIAAGFLVRIFIIFHDCGHGSFFRSRRANDLLGFVAGVLTLTPSHQWWHEHAVHHATAGDLDRRGVGDVWTLTVDEYRSASRWTRITYWFFRNPFFMFSVGPFLMFAIVNRFPHKTGGRREKMSVLWTNMAVAGAITMLCLTIGWKAYVLVHLPVFLFAGSAGIWLFYVQHQFDGVYWEHHEEWDYVRTAVEGSSYFRLPRLLQWFSGNIGFHHIHHLNARIPNYRLEACHRENPAFQEVPTVTLRSSLQSLGLRLWDDKVGRMVGFKAARDPAPVKPAVAVSP
jgi:omega-6 fatty acid desaturase (delta-12 desaturase)